MLRVYKYYVICDASRKTFSQFQIENRYDKK